MFTTDAIIDAVQNTQKTFVKTFVQNETVADAMTQYIDAQSETSKKVARATTDMLTKVTGETVKAVQNASKFDYTKFGEGIMNAYQTQTAKKSK